MATHTIGTGGDFSTVQAWEDDIPATLTEPRIGQVKNEELTVAGDVLVVSAHTTSETNNIILEAVSGGSFRDHANVRTNPLRYDATKGASLRATATGMVIKSQSTSNFTIRNLQLKSDGTSGYSDTLGVEGGTVVFQNLIVEGFTTSRSLIYSHSSGVANLYNCLLIARANADSICNKASGGSPWTMIGCTIVKPSNLGAGSTDGAVAIYANGIIVKNCLFFGLVNDATNLDGSSDYNATSFSDAASGLPDNTPDHNVYDVTYDTTLFVQPSDSGGNHDFRTVAGSAIENAGIYDGTNSPEDISGLTRNDPPEIGAWELAAAAETVNLMGDGEDAF